MDTYTGEVKEFDTQEELDKMFNENEPDRWADLTKIFATGKVIEVEGTKWEIRRADIRPGNPGKVTLKLRGMPTNKKED